MSRLARFISILSAVLLLSIALTVDLLADPGSGQSQEQVKHERYAHTFSGSRAVETKTGDEDARLLTRAAALEIPDESYKADDSSPSAEKKAAKNSQLRRAALVILLSLFDGPLRRNP